MPAIVRRYDPATEGTAHQVLCGITQHPPDPTLPQECQQDTYGHSWRCRVDRDTGEAQDVCRRCGLSDECGHPELGSV